MNKPIVILPGGIWQADIVNFWKNKGHFVYVVNPVFNDTVKIADHWIECDVMDLEAVYAKICKIVKNPLAIISDQSDIVCGNVAVLSSRLGLIHNDIKAVEQFSTHKKKMYDLASDLGISVGRYRECRNVDEVIEFTGHTGFPLVIKPVDGTNSRGFGVLRAFADADSLFNNAIRFSINKAVIAQEFLQGDHQVTIEGFCQEKKHYNLCASSKGDYWNPSLTSSLVWHPEFNLKEVLAANNRFVEGSGLEFGITHAEYIVDTRRDKFWLNEIACRGGGFRIGSEIIRLATGFNAYNQLYDIILGRSPSPPAIKAKRAVALQFYCESEMKLVCQDRIEIIRKIPGVFEFNYNFNKNSFLSDCSNIRHSYAILEADTLEQCDKIRTDVKHEIVNHTGHR